MKAISYKVTVTALVERVEQVGHKWERTTAAPDSPYAYTPEIEGTVLRETTIFEQRLDTLDMRALVAVMNGLPAPEVA